MGIFKMIVNTEEKILIDKLVHTGNKNEIIDIVKKLVPAATEFTAMCYACHTKYGEDYEIDKIMDIEKKSDRVKFLKENCSNYGEDFFNDMLNLAPYMPLTDEERLYRPKYLKSDAPKRKNKYLEGVAISNQDWHEMHPVERYIVRAMSNNSDFDWKAAKNFVLSETKKILENYRKTSTKKAEKISEPIEHEDFYFMHSVLTQYMKRQNFFTRKLYPYMNEEEVIDSGYELLLINLQSLTDPNYTVRSSISVDFTFAKMAEDYHNEEMQKKNGKDYKIEIFSETFMKVLKETV